MGNTEQTCRHRVKMTYICVSGISNERQYLRDNDWELSKAEEGNMLEFWEALWTLVLTLTGSTHTK